LNSKARISLCTIAIAAIAFVFYSDSIVAQNQALAFHSGSNGSFTMYMTHNHRHHFYHFHTTIPPHGLTSATTPPHGLTSATTPPHGLTSATTNGGPGGHTTR